MPAWPLARNRRLLWCFAWAVATACLVIFLLSFDLRAAWSHIAGADPVWIVVALLANFAVLPLLTEQWVWLLPRARPIRWSVLWDCVTISVAAMNALPFGGGHAVAVGLLATRGAVGVDGGLSLMALEQLCDGFAKLALLLVALAFAPLPLVLQHVTWSLAVAVLAGFLALLWVANHPVHEEPARGWRARWGRHLEVLRRPRVFLVAVGLSLAMKLVTLVAMYAVQLSLGIDLPATSAPLVLAAVTFATLVTVAPGHLGIYEAAAFAAYRLLGVPEGEAVALGLLQHACFLLPLLGTGYTLMVWRAVTASRTAMPEAREVK